MSVKTLLFFAQALLIQSITCQCIGYNGIPYDGLGYGAPLAGPCGPLAAELPLAPYALSSGGSFAVSSTSPLSPSGISVFSENVIEGPLIVEGVLPFLGTVALEAVLPTAGAGTVAYGCGDAGVAITAEDYGFGPYGPGFGGPGYAGPGYAGPGYAGPGFAGPGYAGPGYAGPGYGFGPGCGAFY